MRTLPIRRVGTRDNLLFGGDREIILAGCVAALMLGSSLDPLGLMVGAGFWTMAFSLARLMAKKDPKLRRVYLRHRSYAAYYPARSTPFRENSPRQARRYAP